MFIAKVFKGSSLKKTLVIVWVLGRLKKISKNTFFVLNIYQSVTHISTSISRELFKKIAFRSVALVIKTVKVYFNLFFYTDQTF